MSELNVKLKIFEGPLDLLLHLIKTLEIDIYDIPIAEITAQYMDYIRTMKTLELEVAGEYLVMAATLMEIKSKMLLPAQEVILEEDDDFEEDQEDPRQALVAQLLEYRKYKYAADQLREQAADRLHYHTRPPEDVADLIDEKIPLKELELTVIDLFFAFHQAVIKKQDKQPKHKTITSDTVTVEKKIKTIRQQLAEHPNEPVAFTELFENYTRSEIVTTFMALLELAKSGELFIQQDNMDDSIFLYQKVKLEEETNE